VPFVEHVPPSPACRDPRHDPPGSVVLKPGVHVWRCPACDQVQRIHVREVLARAAVTSRVETMLRRSAGGVQQGLDAGAIGGGVVWTAVTNLPDATRNRQQSDAMAHEFVEWVRKNLGEPIDPWGGP
jgi:hypothetical protein